ncbi:MAG TPA: ABC transporter permease, partial [Flavisolibacter sp.]|nr:ABC transporter permease [Flavisolibacter sp.]
MLIILYGKDEVSYDRFHTAGNHIYRVTSDMVHEDGSIFRSGSTGMLPGPQFAAAIPEITDYVRVQNAYYTVKKGTQVFDQEALFADANFFSVFTFPLLAGNPETALTDIHSIVLSEEVAEKYFGKKNAVGEILELNTGEKFEPFMVSAVLRRSPQNSSLKIKMLLPMKFQQSQNDDKQWFNFFLNTFVVLRPGADPAAVTSRISQVFRKESAEQLKEMVSKYAFRDKVTFGLQPLFSMHLSTDYPSDNGLTDASNPIY